MKIISIKNCISLFIASLFLLQGCGYEKLYISDKKIYQIKKIEISGDQKISNIVKNEILLFSGPSAEKIINLKIDVQSAKSVKEKLVSGKISKYNIAVSADLNLRDINFKTLQTQQFHESATLEVSKIHSDTLIDQRKMIKSLSEKIAESITDYLNLYFKNK